MFSSLIFSFKEFSCQSMSDYRNGYKNVCYPINNFAKNILRVTFTGDTALTVSLRPPTIIADRLKGLRTTALKTIREHCNYISRSILKLIKSKIAPHIFGIKVKRILNARRSSP